MSRRGEPDCSLVEERPGLWLQFRVVVGRPLDVDGRFIPVARSRRSVRWVAQKHGLVVADGVIDGAPGQAVVVLVTSALIQVALIPKGRGTLVAIKAGADVAKVLPVARLFFDGKLRMLR
jgi:hypothetical protein